MNGYGACVHRCVHQICVHYWCILRYDTILNTKQKASRLKEAYRLILEVSLVSGWRDSNSRPPAPKAGALTGLRHTPIMYSIQLGE